MLEDILLRNRRYLRVYANGLCGIESASGVEDVDQKCLIAYQREKLHLISRNSMIIKVNKPITLVSARNYVCNIQQAGVYVNMCNDVYQD